MVFGVLLLAQLVLGAALVILLMTIEVARSASASGAMPSQAEIASMLGQLSDSSSYVFLSLSAGVVLDLALSLIPARLSTTPWRQRLRSRPSEISPKTLVGIVLLFLAISSISDLLFGAFGWKAKGTIDLLASVFSGASAFNSFLGALLMALGCGFGEELLFRGYIQTRLSQRWGRWIGIVVTAALFGLLHMDPVQSVFAFGVALFLGWITERTGSIRPAMASHAFNNFAWAMSVGFVRGFSRATNSVLLVLFVAVGVFGVLYLRKALPDGREALDPSATPTAGAPALPTM
jgi:membrane protease YdiL (CAAX protease family)